MAIDIVFGLGCSCGRRPQHPVATYRAVPPCGKRTVVPAAWHGSDRARAVCASQCVGLGLTASVGSGSRGCDLGIVHGCRFPGPVRSELVAIWWPGVRRSCRRLLGQPRGFRRGVVPSRQSRGRPGFRGRGRRRAASLSAVPVGRTELDRVVGRCGDLLRGRVRVTGRVDRAGDRLGGLGSVGPGPRDLRQQP